MNQFDIEQPARVPPWRSASRSLRAPSAGAGGDPAAAVHGGRLILLRKYSIVICMVEALAIVLLVYLLLKIPPPSEQQFSATAPNGNVSHLNAPYRTYCAKSAPGATAAPSARFLLGLVADCDQRRHDLGLSVQCPSRKWQDCAPVESTADGEAAPLSSPISGREGAGRQQQLVGFLVETSKSGARLARRRVRLQQVPCGPTTRCGRFGTRIEVDPSKRHQQIVGWGGALTDSAVNNLLALTMNGTRRLLDDYFGPGGLRFNMIRVTLGGSDFSARFYTNDDLDEQPAAETANEGSSEAASRADQEEEEARWLDRFKLREEDLLYKIPVLQIIKRELAPQVKLFGSMWSPPVWMKTNRHFNKGQLKGAIDDEPLRGLDAVPSNERFYRALARLKLKFLDEYRRRGLDFWGLTVMNEPVFAVQPFLDFNTMIFPRDDYGNYVGKHLGPLLRSNPATRRLKLMVHDDNRRFLRNFTAPLLDQTRIRQFVDGVTVHGYIDEEYDQLDAIYERYRPGAAARTSGAPADDWFVLPTELCSGHLPFMEKALAGNWHRGVHYALDIIRSLQHSAGGWVDWNMILDTEGGPGWLGGRLDAPVLVDKKRDLYHKSPMFYVLGQFSRYIAPESTRVSTRVYNRLYDGHFEVVTFELAGAAVPGQLATVVVNNNHYPVAAHLRVRPAEGRDQEAGYSLLECPADSVITLVYSATLGPA